jgi:hypothetical protein
MKIAFVEATLPELKGGTSRQEGRGTGSNAAIAISRAMKAVLKKIPRKHVSIIQCKIIITTKADGEVVLADADNGESI